VPFKAILQDLVRSIDGAVGAILTDWEGEAVEQYSLTGDEYDLKILGAHQNIILSRIRDIRHKMPSQSVRDAIITTDRQHLFLGAVGDEYALVLLLERSALVGRVRVQALCSVRLLEKEIY
jgi:predicted regulator of Ras-like GTPase activity (Roadblock/LC7/MglB family)